MNSVILDWLDFIIFYFSVDLIVETDVFMLKNFTVEFAFVLSL